MARLPDPVVGEMPIAWPDEYKKININFNNMVAQAIRNKKISDERKIEEGEDKEK